jgi:phosphonate transport system ATP-binding protein
VTSAPLIALQGVSLGYGNGPVLRDVTLRIEAGEKVAFVGASGAGKSTLLGHLYDRLGRRAALVPQQLALVKNLSVFHNVYMGRLHHHSSLYNLANLLLPLSREVRAVAPLVARLGLSDKLQTPAGELSGGQQQRTAVARALFQGGDVLLGDEPVSSVDVLQAREVLAGLREAFPTLILAMHDVNLALAYADRVIGLKEGAIVLDRPSAELTPSDLHPLYRP